MDGKERALVCMSGGQDSATCLYWALQNFGSVEAITFNYGQRHSDETDQAKLICDRVGVLLKVVNIEELMKVNKSALLDKYSDVGAFNEHGLPSSFVPNRNQIFLTIAHTYAITQKISTIITGVCQTDYSGYPDCRNEFVKSLETTLRLGSGEDIKIKTPLMWLDKAETFKLAEEIGCLDVVLKDTLTCYNGVRTMHEWGMGCQVCPSCKLRMDGYKKYKDGRVQEV